MEIKQEVAIPGNHTQSRQDQRVALVDVVEHSAGSNTSNGVNHNIGKLAVGESHDDLVHRCPLRRKPNKQYKNQK